VRADKPHSTRHKHSHRRSAIVRRLLVESIANDKVCWFLEVNRKVLNRCTDPSVNAAMRLTDDLTSPKAILAKGWLFLVLGVLAGASVVVLTLNWQVAALLAITVWAFCRWYYFMFYVIEKYVDPSFRFAGLGSFLRYSFSGSGDSSSRAPASEDKEYHE